MSDPSRAIRISGNHNDIDYWRFRFSACPSVSLDGVVITAPIKEARSGELGYVVTELCDAIGKPVLANVVLPDGRVVDHIIATETRHGVVSIHGVEWPRVARSAS